MLGSRFRILCADAGLSVDAAAQLLHVTPRTIRYWFSGKVGVPYAAYKLVRVLRLFELPCPGWEGWHMHSGRLWSPEGHGFLPSDSNWWGLLVRKASHFHVLYDRQYQLDALLNRLNTGAGATLAATGRGAPPPGRATAGALPTGAAGRAAQPAGLDLSLRHFGTSGKKHRDAPASDRNPSSQSPLTSGGEK